MWFKRDFYQTKEWKSLRAWALKKYGAKCQKCSSTQDIQVDHILPRSLFPRLKLNKANLGILCKACNLKKAARIEKDYRTIRFRIHYYMINLLKKVYLIALTVFFGLGCWHHQEALIAFGAFLVPFLTDSLEIISTVFRDQLSSPPS